MQVTITQEHINNGVKNSATSCPIALALKDTGWRRPYVWSIDCYDRGPEPYMTKYLLSLKAQRFVENFDTGKPVQPATFRFRPC